MVFLLWAGEWFLFTLHKLFASNGRYYIPCTASEEESIKERMLEELKRDNGKSIKQTEETSMSLINEVCSNARLNMFLKRYLSNTSSYKKIVSRDWVTYGTFKGLITSYRHSLLQQWEHRRSRIVEAGKVTKTMRSTN